MKLSAFAGLCGATLLLIACGSDPHDYRVTEDNKDSITQDVKDLKGLTVEENRLLLAFLVRHELAGAFGGTPAPIVGRRVGDMIAEQQSFEAELQVREAEQARLATEAAAKEEAQAAELRDAINLTVFHKGFTPSDAMAGEYSDYITVKCAYENTSGRDIRAFTGTVRFADLFGKLIFESGLTIMEPIEAGESAKWDGSVEYNQFTDSHKALRFTKLEDMKIAWLPQSIIFSDGSRIGDAAHD